MSKYSFNGITRSVISPTNKNGWPAEMLYLQAEKLLLEGRVNSTLTNEQEDELLEAMDYIWRYLTDEQRIAADRRAQAYHETQLKGIIRNSKNPNIFFLHGKYNV